MATVLAVGDLVRVTIKQLLHGQDILNVLYYRVTVADPAFTDQSIATWVATNIVASMKTVQSDELAHEAVFAQKFFPLPPKVPVIDTTNVGTGSIIEVSLPSEVTSVFTKGTAFAGRKYRGRFFLGGIPRSDDVGSTLNPAREVAYNVIGVNLVATVAPVGVLGRAVPVIYHRATNATDEIISCFVRLTFRAQRRRQLGKGK